MENGIDCDYSEVIAGWQIFWNALDGKEHDFSKIAIPPKPEGKSRLLAIDNISSSRLYKEYEWRMFMRSSLLCGDDIDGYIMRNERDAQNGPYAVWVRDEVEAGDFLVNIDPHAIDNIAAETFNECLIHELIFVKEMGQCLTMRQNLTLCIGSPTLDGRFPLVGNLAGDGIIISFEHPYGLMHGHWHIRRVFC